MLYRFRCKATGDLIMLAPQGDRMLRLLGREPAVQGIIEPAAMPAAIQALQAAVESAERAGTTESAASVEEATNDDEPVSLRRRLWPMIEMLRQAEAAREPVVWGV